MRRRLSALIACLPFVVTAIAHTEQTARGRGFATSSSSRVISPAVVSTYRAHTGDGGAPVLELLVLWRGSAGWFARGGRGHSSGSSGGGDGRGYEWASFGGITVALEINLEANIVTIKGQEISLRDTNVVLVDFVDSASGPTILGTRWIDPELPRTGDPVANVIKRSPELFDFLRCDLRLTDAAMQAMLTYVCGQMRGQ